jgi:ubiquinone/menaquinone biosynthesis C-methylase UbiE
MNDYLKKVAAKYDERFRLPDDVRQAEQKMVGEALQAVLLKRNVVEVGCGAGYWTQFISPSAKSVFAFDPREEAILAARERSYFCPVTFERGDVFALPYDDGSLRWRLIEFFPRSDSPRAHGRVSG